MDFAMYQMYIPPGTGSRWVALSNVNWDVNMVADWTAATGWVVSNASNGAIIGNSGNALVPGATPEEPTYTGTLFNG